MSIFILNFKVLVAALSVTVEGKKGKCLTKYSNSGCARVVLLNGAVRKFLP